MPSIRNVCALLLFATFSFNANGQSKDVTFPTDEEIRLVLTQTDRAIDQYKPLLDQEQQMLGKESVEALAEDRRVLKVLELAIEGLRKNPPRLQRTREPGYLDNSIRQNLFRTESLAVILASGTPDSIRKSAKGLARRLRAEQRYYSGYRAIAILDSGSDERLAWKNAGSQLTLYYALVLRACSARGSLHPTHNGHVSCIRPPQEKDLQSTPRSLARA